MNIQRIYKIGLVALLLVGGLLVGSDGLHAATDHGSRQASRRVLIATEKTAFKQALVEELIAELDDGRTYIRLIDHQAGELQGIKPDNYGVVLVINSGVGSRVRPWVTSWLGSAARRTDNVIVLTTQRDVWTPKLADNIDSVTSASNRAIIGELAADLVSRIERLL